MNSRQAEEARLAYVESGTGAPVVFIHGLTFSRRTWDPIVRRLEGRFRCIAIDLPGHGASPGVSDALELDDVGHRLHALLTGLGIERPVLVGHSMGAMEATVYGATFPVAGIVNVDQTLDVQPFIRLIQEIAPVLGGPNFSAAFEPIRLGIGVELLPEPLRSQTLATQTVSQDVVLAFWSPIIRGAPEELQALVDTATSRISVPYLAVFGHRLEDDERAALYGRLSGLELEEWPGGGHMVHLMEPARFAHRVGDFVATCSA